MSAVLFNVHNDTTPNWRREQPLMEMHTRLRLDEPPEVGDVPVRRMVTVHDIGEFCDNASEGGEGQISMQELLFIFDDGEQGTDADMPKDTATHERRPLPELPTVMEQEDDVGVGYQEFKPTWRSSYECGNPMTFLEPIEEQADSEDECLTEPGDNNMTTSSVSIESRVAVSVAPSLCEDKADQTDKGTSDAFHLSADNDTETKEHRQDTPVVLDHADFLDNSPDVCRSTSPVEPKESTLPTEQETETKSDMASVETTCVDGVLASEKTLITHDQQDDSASSLSIKSVDEPMSMVRHYKSMDGWRWSTKNHSQTSFATVEGAIVPSVASANETTHSENAPGHRQQKPFEPLTVVSPSLPDSNRHVPLAGMRQSSHESLLRHRVSKEAMSQQHEDSASSVAEFAQKRVMLTPSHSVCSRCSSTMSTTTASRSLAPPSPQDQFRNASFASSRQPLHSPYGARPISVSGIPSSWDVLFQSRPSVNPSLVSVLPPQHGAGNVPIHQQRPPSPMNPLVNATSPLPAGRDAPMMPPAGTTADGIARVPSTPFNIASFSLTHNKDAIKTYRRMAAKTHNKNIQMTYANYLLQVAQIHKDTPNGQKNSNNLEIRERLLAEAGYWIERLAKAGHPEALLIKGKWHLHPETEDCAASYQKPQPNKAVKCLLASSRGGCTEAYFELAGYYKSRGEYTLAVSCYRTAAANGHTKALYKMAKILLRGQLQQKRNIQLGLDYLKRAADAAGAVSAEPAYVLSCVYADELERIGLASESQMPRVNLPQSFVYLQKAVHFEIVTAIHRMGEVYEKGLLGQMQDHQKAFHYFSRAAEDGHEGAMYDLSRMYLDGIPGYLPPQPEMAFKWCQRAAEKRLCQAEYILGTFYEHGIGTMPDYARALEYYGRAASKGHTLAADKLNLPTEGDLKMHLPVTKDSKSIPANDPSMLDKANPTACLIM